MFRQSIDPKGAFPPKSSKKPVKKPKKKPIKRRKKTRDRFSAERKQEQVFKFGERRSGLSGRQIFNPPPQQQSNFSPGDYLRIHQQAIANQIREQAEKKATGGTFTGTSIAEEKRVREQQQADREFRRQEAETRRRFVGALERFVDKATEPKPDTEILRDIKEEIKTAKVPVIKLGDKPKPEESFGIADIEDITERRPPEDDINYLSSTRSKRTPTPAPPIPAPRPSPRNPIDAKGRAEIEAIREFISTPRPEPEPQLTIEKEITPKDRRKLFLEEQDDTDEFLTPLQPPDPIAEQKTISVDKPTEIPITAPPLVQAKEELSPPPEPAPKKLTPEEIAKLSRQTIKEAEEDLEQDTTTEEEDIDAGSKRPEEEIKLEARLQTYQALADLQKPPGSENPSFDGKPEHYRLVILEDIPPETLGRQRGQPGFKKGNQHRIKTIQNSDKNRGMNFYKRGDGKMDLSSGNLGNVAFRINFETQGKKIQKAIREGKVKIVFDNFEDEI